MTPLPSDPAADFRGLTARAVEGTFINVGSTVVTAVLGFARAVLLARLLAPEQFGLMAFALFYISLANRLTALGLARAIVNHPNPDETTLRTYFALRFAANAAGLLVVALAAPLLGQLYPQMPLLPRLLWVLVISDLVGTFAKVQDAMLARAMAFAVIAKANVISGITMILVAPYLAWQGWGVWALVAEGASGVLVRLWYVWAVFPEARPRLGWDPAAVRWFWSYGRPTWLAVNLSFVLEQFDYFWIGTMFGQGPLGFYTRAYEFAGYPGRVVAPPLLDAFFPAFARLQHDRQRLSQTFVRVIGLLVRAGFGLSLLLIVTGPEVVALLLGERWLPMTLAFQLLVLYAMFAPISGGAMELLMATGRPDLIARTRAAQVAVFVPAVLLLARWWGIVGVALAVDAMVVFGTGLLFWQVRRQVDYSVWALGGWPAVAAVLTGTAVFTLGWCWPAWGPWPLLFAKASVTAILYPSVLWWRDREPLQTAWRVGRAALRSPGPASA